VIKSFNKSSITLRLIILISIGFFIGFTTLSFFCYHFLKTNFQDSYSNFFYNENSVLEKILTKSEINTSSALKQEVIWEPEANHYKYYIEIKNRAGQSIIKTPNIHSIIPKEYRPSSHTNTIDNPLLIRIKQKTFALFKSTLTTHHAAYKALMVLDITKYAKILNKFRSDIILISSILIFIFLLVGILLIKLGLSPLRFFNKKIKSITANTLEPLKLRQLPSELELLLAEINQLILRTKISYENLASFSSNIAHELRTPINNLMISNEMFLMTANHHPDIKMHLLSNIEEYQRLSNLIDKLLLLARLNTNDKKINLSTLILPDEVNKVIDFHQAMSDEKNMTIHQHSCGSIYADKDLFHNALSNILTNAIKYSPANTAITINTESFSDTIVLSVSDQGPGIPADELPNITSRFYRFNKSVTSKSGGPGLGLGLSIVKSIMLALGGTLEIKLNKPKGVSACLTFQKSNEKHQQL
jgi:two-component system, OmpR family, heavy metal sensor histidine kinase CusS